MAWHFSHRGADTVDCIGHASRRKQPKRLIQESTSYALLKLLKKIIKQPRAQKTALEFYTKCDWWNLLAVIQSHGILVKVWKRKVKLNNRTLAICKKQAITLLKFHGSLSYINLSSQELFNSGKA